MVISSNIVGNGVITASFKVITALCTWCMCIYIGPTSLQNLRLGALNRLPWLKMVGCALPPTAYMSQRL